MLLEGRKVLITGASAGIGKACAFAFAERKANLVLIARRKIALDAIAEEIKEKYSVEVSSIQCDLQSKEEIDAVFASQDLNGHIDILINNAGLARGFDKVHEGSVADWEEMIDTNIKGLLYVSRKILPSMAERGSGTVINIGSIAGREVYPNGAVYCATKHAVKALTHGMAIDLNGTGVRVSNIEPGLVETQFALVRFRGDRDRAEDVYKGYKPLEAKDVADVAVFVASAPERVNLREVLVLPTAQATATIVAK